MSATGQFHADIHEPEGDVSTQTVRLNCYFSTPIQSINCYFSNRWQQKECVRLRTTPAGTAHDESARCRSLHVATCRNASNEFLGLFGKSNVQVWLERTPGRASSARTRPERASRSSLEPFLYAQALVRPTSARHFSKNGPETRSSQNCTASHVRRSRESSIEPELYAYGLGKKKGRSIRRWIGRPTRIAVSFVAHRMRPTPHIARRRRMPPYRSMPPSTRTHWPVM